MAVDKTQPIDDIVDDFDAETVVLSGRVEKLEGLIQAPNPPSVDTVRNDSQLLGKNVVGYGVSARLIDINDARQGRVIATLDTRLTRLEK